MSAFLEPVRLLVKIVTQSPAKFGSFPGDGWDRGNFNAMRTAIDRSGRIVVPKAIRDRLGLRGGEDLEILERDGVIELWPAPMDIDLVETPEGVVARARNPVAPLTAESVRETLEKIRR